MDTIYWKIIFWIIALSVSIFYSSWAFRIHLVDEKIVEEQKDAPKNKAWFIHQWWFNFIGSITGWFLLWILLPTILLTFGPQPGYYLFQLKDVALLLIAIIGITGHLPLTVFGIAVGMNSLINKALRP